MTKFTYVLYLNIDENVEKTIFLGTCKNPQKLFYNSFNFDNVNNEMKPYILDWL